MKRMMLIVMLALCLLCSCALADTTSDGFVYTAGASSVTITGYSGSSTSVVIPDEIGGLPVTAIAANAFLDESSILSVELPANLVSIGESAFSGCWRMKTLTMKEGLKTIGDRAFYECAAITALNFPASLRTIGEYAFYNVNKIYSDLVLPEGLESVGLYAFGKSAFTGIVMPVSLAKRYTTGTSYSASSLYHIFYQQYNKIASVTLLGEGDVGDYAFSGCSGVKALDVSGAKIGSIGANAFSSLMYMAGDLVFSAPLKHIGEKAFYHCYALSSVSLPEGMESIGAGAFNGCNITSITLPEGMKQIGAEAFYGCDELTDMTLPQGLVSIGEKAFNNCSALSGTLTLPESLQSIGSQAFYGTTYSSLSIPASVTAVADAVNKKSALSQMFGSSPKIKSVEITGSGRVADYAFYDYTDLTSVDMSGSSVTELGSYAFYDCYKIASVSLPPQLQSIGDYAFYGCWGIPSIDLPDTVRTLGVRCFYDCEKIKKIVIPEGVTEIPDYAFFYSGITDFTFPQSIRRFGEGVIDAFTTLTTLLLPDYVEEIDVDAFPSDLHLQCSLGSRTSRAITEMIYADTGEDQAEISDPAYPGVMFRTDLEGEGVVTKLLSLESSAAYVEVPEGVHKIWSYALDGLTNMTTLRLPSTYKNIYTYGINNCPNLRSITFPQSASGAIPMYAVKGCTSLESVVIGRGVTYLSDKSFDAVPQTVYGYAGTAAEEYAQKVGAQMIYIDEDNPDSFVAIRSSMNGLVINENQTRDLSGVFYPQPLPLGSDALMLTSLNDDILSVSGTKVTGGTPGDTTLRAALAENPRIYLDLPVHVRRLVVDFALRPIYVSAGCSVKLEVSDVTPADADREFTWMLPDSSLAVIDGDTLTAGGTLGTQQVTVVSFNGVRRTTTLHVTAAVNAISFEKEEDEVFAGDGYQLTAHVTAGTESLINELVEFSSLNEHVATVDRYGRVTTHNAGMARICARAPSGAIAYMTLNVRAIDSLNLPKELKVVEADAFAGANPEQIVVSEACEQIAAGAFVGCDRLVRVKILGADTQIAEGAFDEDASFTVYAPAGSAAQAYAQTHGFAFEAIEP